MKAVLPKLITERPIVSECLAVKFETFGGQDYAKLASNVQISGMQVGLPSVAIEKYNRWWSGIVISIKDSLHVSPECYMRSLSLCPYPF